MTDSHFGGVDGWFSVHSSVLEGYWCWRLRFESLWSWSLPSSPGMDSCRFQLPRKSIVDSTVPSNTTWPPFQRQKRRIPGEFTSEKSMTIPVFFIPDPMSMEIRMSIDITRFQIKTNWRSSSSLSLRNLDAVFLLDLSISSTDSERCEYVPI